MSTLWQAKNPHLIFILYLYIYIYIYIYIENGYIYIYTLRIALNLNQWRSTEYCIKWFNNLDKNDKYSFIKYDIRKFYPSIMEKAVNKALKLAKEYTRISEDKMNIIKHCHKWLLYHNEELWIKKGVNRNFDNPMGSYDLDKISELVVVYKLNDIIDPSCHRLYWDDKLIIIDNCTPRKGDIIWKKLHLLFNKLGFKLDIQANLKITDYLDVTFNS